MTAPLSKATPSHSAHDQADSLAFKAAMRHLVGGVSIVTMAFDGKRGGLAATSVTSLSAEPPSLIVCIKQSSSALPLLRQGGRFGVSILGHDHQAIADRFAGVDGSKGEERFAGADWLGGPDTAPVLANALASFACEVEETIDRFSHTIVIGRVIESRARGGDAALVYWRAAYAKLAQS